MYKLIVTKGCTKNGTLTQKGNKFFEKDDKYIDLYYNIDWESMYKQQKEVMDWEGS